MATITISKNSKMRVIKLNKNGKARTPRAKKPMAGKVYLVQHTKDIDNETVIFETVDVFHSKSDAEKLMHELNAKVDEMQKNGVDIDGDEYDWDDVVEQYWVDEFEVK